MNREVQAGSGKANRLSVLTYLYANRIAYLQAFVKRKLLGLSKLRPVLPRK